MILRTPPLKKRKAELKLLEDNYDDNIDRPGSSKQLQVYEDLPVAELSHEHSTPITSDQMLCTYQCRQMVKSEFFDALSSAEKQARDYESKFEVLNKDFSKVEAQNKNFHDKIFNVEQELAAARGREQMLREQLKKEGDFFQRQLRNHIESSSELEVKFRNEMDLRKKAESSAAKAEEKAEVLEEKLSTLSESREREKSRLQNELTELRSESKLSISRISADLEKMRLRAKSAEGESVLLKQHLEKLKKRLDESIQEKIEIEKKLSFKLPEVSSVDAALLVKQLQGEMRNMESELREAKTLKASNEDIKLLKEKLHGEKVRRERAEMDLLKLTELQLNVSKLEDELSVWKSLIKEIPGVSCADDILTKLAALQKEVVESMMTASDARARMKEIQVALDAAVLAKRNAETEAADVKEKAESCKTEVRSLELMIDMLKAERDGLKQFFNKELKENRDRGDGTESGGRTIIQELESSLAKKENYARELEKSLSEAKNSSGLQQNEIKVLKERLMNEERRIKMLEREDDRLRAEICLLESKIGHGDFSSAKTKVLRMVNTLAVENEAKLTIEALQNELQKTKEKLLAAEELKKQSPDAGALVDSSIAGTIKQLKEQIAILEKREQRYKTVFAERISVFRRACCELFGYKIVMDDHQRADGMPVTRLTLHSIYALNDDEKLQFEYEPGNTNIVVNEYASQPDISRQVDIFIRKMNSIPAFTANLTVESFNKRTLS